MAGDSIPHGLMPGDFVSEDVAVTSRQDDVKILDVPSATHSYQVVIGSDLLQRAGKYVADAIGSTAVPVFVVYDEVLAQFGYPNVVIESLTEVFGAVGSISVPSGESSKSIEQAMRLYSAFIEHGLDRNAVVIALGGGVVGDLTGFAAATYMRGVRFIQIPTTLLAHDASIGGKVAIDIPEGKNLVGAFHAPSLVLYDAFTLRSLPLRERSGGLAEAIKHGVIQNVALFAFLEQHVDELLYNSSDLLSELLYRSCSVKTQIVSVDEREHGLRAILNFGHTIGHAVEALMDGEVSHGEAVAIGMVFETRLAIALGLAKPDTESRLITLLERAKLPTKLPTKLRNDDQIERVIEWMRHDKKAVRRSLSFVLPTQIGQVQIMKDVDEADVFRILTI